MIRIEFDINGLQGQQDAAAVQESLSGVEGVTSAAVDSRGRVTLRFDGDTRPIALSSKAQAAVRAAGYEVASTFAPQSPWGRGRWFRRAAGGGRELLVQG